MFSQEKVTMYNFLKEHVNGNSGALMIWYNFMLKQKKFKKLCLFKLEYSIVSYRYMPQEQTLLKSRKFGYLD